MEGHSLETTGCEPPSAHQLGSIPGVTVWTVAWDILHGLYLGPTQQADGNILEDLMHLRPLGRTMEERDVWSVCLEAYQLIVSRTVFVCSSHVEGHAEAEHDEQRLHRAPIGNDEESCRILRCCRLSRLLLHQPQGATAKTALNEFLLHYTWLSSDAIL